LDGDGNPREPHQPKDWMTKWELYIALPLDPPRRGRSICQYLREEAESTGLRVLIDWLFHAYYDGVLTRWVLSREFRRARERIMVVCFEDLMSPERDLQTVAAMLFFLFNDNDGTTIDLERLERGGTGGYNGPHATSHNSATREHLVSAIKKLDEEVFDGEIAWLDSIFPCR